MTETIQYTYSKNTALLGVLLPLIFFTITFNNLRYSYLSGFILSWVLIAVADLVFLIFLIFILFKRLLPAFRNEVALELNEDGITDYTRNIIVEWAEVKNIDMQLARNFSKMIIDLKEQTDYGTQIAISLRWIAGNDLEICQTTQAYFEEMTRLR
jgi:hypothetical protein